MPTTEESLALIAELMALHLSRDVSISFNGGKVLYHIEGRSVTGGEGAGGLGQPFTWTQEAVPGASPPVSHILRATTRAAPLALELPASLLSGATGPVSVKDESGQAGDHPITITAESGALIDGQASLIIDQPYAAVGMYPADGAWHVLWWHVP